MPQNLKKVLWYLFLSERVTRRMCGLLTLQDEWDVFIANFVYFEYELMCCLIRFDQLMCYL